MRSTFFWLLSFGGLAAVSLLCGILVWPQLSAAWPSIEEKIDRFRRLPPLAKLVLLLFVGAFVVYGSTKTNQVDQTSGTNIVEIVEGGTNDVDQVKGEGEGEQRNLLTCSAGQSEQESDLLCSPSPFTFTSNPPTVTPEDIVRGWQLWEVRTNCNVSYTMPEGAALASNWWVRGAFEDCSIVRLGDCSIGGYVSQSNNLNNPNNQTMSFPFGTNEYDSVWAFTWGKIRFELGNTNTEIVAVGAPMSAVPYRSRLWSAADTNRARVVTWENFVLGRERLSAPAGESAGGTVNAQIELRSTGDFITRSNEVETVYRRIDDFDWDGDGILNWSDWNPYWHDGDYTGQEDWWREYVDEMVGTGLENGYYKLTASFPQAGFRRTVLTVGWEEIVVAEPGEYVFLLEKGEDYEFDIEPFSPDVSFEVVDDIPILSPQMSSYWGWGWWMNWTIDGGSLNFTVPSFNRPGYCCWMPTFQATPPMSHLGPGDSPQTFTAVLTDYAYSQSVEYYWYSDDWNVDISDPYSEETDIDVCEMPRWRSSSVTVMATFGNHTLESTCSFTYGEHETPQTTLELSAPDALLLNSNNVDSAKIGQVDVTFIPDIPTNGTLLLYCIDGAARVRLIGSCSRSVTGEESFSVDVEGVRTSEVLDDVTLCATFTPEGGGEPLSAQSSLTVVQVNDVVLPGAPNDGLVISTGTSVALDLELFPEGADELLSVIYRVRRLRGNGTYTDWEYAAGNYGGTGAIYNPSEGGIYQVQALAGLGWGAEEERYYRWQDYSDYVHGVKVLGEMKAFGVCDSEWQKSVRNSAKSYLGDSSYGFASTVGAHGGFSAVRSDSWKCNIFVAHRLVDCMLPVPVVHHGRLGNKDWPPLANEWGNDSFEILNWEILELLEFPQPGMVVVQPSAGPNGHMGIMDFDGMAISAQAQGVTRASNAAKWKPLVCRTYKEN